MDCLTDHCVFKQTVEYLRGLGYNVVTVRELGLTTCRDKEIAQKAGLLKKVLITNDKDFCNIFHFEPELFYGLIVLKITRVTLPLIHLVLKQVLTELSAETLCHSLVVIDLKGYRIYRKIS